MTGNILEKHCFVVLNVKLQVKGFIVQVKRCTG